MSLIFYLIAFLSSLKNSFVLVTAPNNEYYAQCVGSIHQLHLSQQQCLVRLLCSPLPMNPLCSFLFLCSSAFVSAELKLCHNGNPGRLNGRLTLGWGTPFCQIPWSWKNKARSL